VEHSMEHGSQWSQLTARGLPIDQSREGLFPSQEHTYAELGGKSLGEARRPCGQPSNSRIEV